MSLFRKASQVAKKFKICVYGPPGSGKTVFGLTFPKPAYIDMEHGSDWLVGRKNIIDGINLPEDFDALYTKSAATVIEAITEVERDLAKDSTKYESIVIDPVTIFWEAIQDAYVSRRRKKDPDFEVRFNHWREIKNPYKKAMTTLLNLPLHMILIGREAIKYDMKGKELIEVGTKIAAEKDTPYVADIYLEMVPQHGPNSMDRFFARVEKDRTHLLKKGSLIENCTYQKLVELRDAAGIGVKGVEYKQEDDEEVVQKDAALFEESEQIADNDELGSLINDEAIKSLWKELDWAPGKVKALIQKHNLLERDTLGKFLASEVRKQRAEKKDANQD